jgi:hypothetical protein
MIFVTNNSSACRLMVENMWNRKEKGGDRQQSLFELDIESQLIDEKTIEKKVEDLVPRQEEIGFNDLLAEFYSMYGLIFPIKTLKSTLESLRVKGSIIIRRIPRLTQTGKVSCFWDEVNGHKVKIRRIDRELQKQYY